MRRIGLSALLAGLALMSVGGASHGGQHQGNPHQAGPHPALAQPKQQPLPPPDGYQNYRTLLGKMCAVKHLEMLSPGELDDLIEVNFHDALAPALQTKLDEADRTEKAACAKLTMGLACFNIAYIRAMDDVKILPRFARMVCDSGIVCRAPAECERPR